MGKEDKEPDEQPQLTLEQKNKLLLIDTILRINSDYKEEELQKSTIPTLEALYEAEKLRENSKKKDPEPSFIKAPITHTPDLKKNEKKENAPSEDEIRFNVLEVFKSQYIHPSRLKNCLVDENCEIFTMRVNANPKFPEWQVS